MIPALVALIAVAAAVLLTLVWMDTPTQRERERADR